MVPVLCPRLNKRREEVRKEGGKRTKVLLASLPGDRSTNFIFFAVVVSSSRV